MITPLDIQNKVFSKGVRGYKEEEVDGFLDLITLDLENIMEENGKLKDQIKSLTADLDGYKKSESAVLETLEAAKSLMRDISASAEKRAQILVKNAELDAELILRGAKESVERLNEESQSLKSRLSIFRARYKTLLESELQKFDLLSSEIFSDENMNELQEITKGEIFTNQEDVADFKTITNLRTGEKH